MAYSRPTHIDGIPLVWPEDEQNLFAPLLKVNPGLLNSGSVLTDPKPPASYDWQILWPFEIAGKYGFGDPETKDHPQSVKVYDKSGFYKEVHQGGLFHDVNQDGQFTPGIDVKLINITLYIFEDGVELEDAFKKITAPDSNEIILFVENNTGDTLTGAAGRQQSAADTEQLENMGICQWMAEEPYQLNF
jgi:hypothetical protein